MRLPVVKMKWTEYQNINSNAKHNVFASNFWQNTIDGMSLRTLMGWISAYGGFPSAISIAVIPKDQMSAKQS